MSRSNVTTQGDGDRHGFEFASSFTVGKNRFFARPWVAAFPFPDKPCASPGDGVDGCAPGGRVGASPLRAGPRQTRCRESGGDPTPQAHTHAPLGPPKAEADLRVPLRQAVWVGGLGPAEGAGLRRSGLPPAAPVRRAYGVSKVTLRTATFSESGGNTYEHFHDLPRRAPGERPPRPRRFRRRVRNLGALRAFWPNLGGFYGTGSCLKFKTIHRSWGEGERSVTSPY